MSTFTVTCPNCKNELEADDTNVGMMVECPLCHQQFEIRRPDTPPATPAPQPPPPPAAPSSQGYAPYPSMPAPGMPAPPQGYAPYPAMPVPGMPTPPQGYAPGSAVPPGYTAPRRAISWTPALVCKSVCIVLTVVLAIVSLATADSYYKSEEEAILEGILGLGVFVAAILNVVFSMILHYKCWKALPWPFNNVSAMGPVTPGKAVGFLFIPFFNFYWVFPSFAGLGKGWNNWAVATGKVAPTNPQLPPKTSMPALSMTLAVLSLLSWILNWVPIVGLLLDVAAFVVWIFLYKNVVRYANSPDAWPV